MAPDITTPNQAPADATLRLYSAINRFFYFFRKRARWGRKHYHESPAWELLGLSNPVQKRFDALRELYSVRFENLLSRENALENYHLLDLLDQLKTRWHWSPPPVTTLIDVGSKNFYYARTLQAFFRPEKLIGVELDAFRLYRDFHTRHSYAMHYIASIKNAEYIAGDFCDYQGTADALTFFYPFVIPEPLVRWDLPLAEFKPAKIFQKAHQVLKENGFLLMLNQGKEEFDAARQILIQEGFELKQSVGVSETILPRLNTPMASLWGKTPAVPAESENTNSNSTTVREINDANS